MSVVVDLFRSRVDRGLAAWAPDIAEWLWDFRLRSDDRADFVVLLSPVVEGSTPADYVVAAEERGSDCTARLVRREFAAGLAAFGPPPAADDLACAPSPGHVWGAAVFGVAGEALYLRAFEVDVETGRACWLSGGA